MGKYDVAANIEFILKKTGAEKLTYIGHSQGASQFLVSNMLRYDIGPKVETFIGLAPVMYSQYQNSVLLHEFKRFGIDVLLEDAFWSLLFVQLDQSLKSRIFVDLSLWALDTFPRTTWKAI